MSTYKIQNSHDIAILNLKVINLILINIIVQFYMSLNPVQKGEDFACLTDIANMVIKKETCQRTRST